MRRTHTDQRHAAVGAERARLGLDRPAGHAAPTGLGAALQSCLRCLRPPVAAASTTSATGGGGACVASVSGGEAYRTPGAVAAAAASADQRSLYAFTPSQPWDYTASSFAAQSMAEAVMVDAASRAGGRLY